VARQRRCHINRLPGYSGPGTKNRTGRSLFAGGNAVPGLESHLGDVISHYQRGGAKTRFGALYRDDGGFHAVAADARSKQEVTGIWRGTIGKRGRSDNLRRKVGNVN